MRSNLLYAIKVHVYDFFILTLMMYVLILVIAFELKAIHIGLSYYICARSPDFDRNLISIGKLFFADFLSCRRC